MLVKFLKEVLTRCAKGLIIVSLVAPYLIVLIPDRLQDGY